MGILWKKKRKQKLRFKIFNFQRHNQTRSRTITAIESEKVIHLSIGWPNDWPVDRSSGVGVIADNKYARSIDRAEAHQQTSYVKSLSWNVVCTKALLHRGQTCLMVCLLQYCSISDDKAAAAEIFSMLHKPRYKIQEYQNGYCSKASKIVMVIQTKDRQQRLCRPTTTTKPQTQPASTFLLQSFHRAPRNLPGTTIICLSPPRPPNFSEEVWKTSIYTILYVYEVYIYPCHIAPAQRQYLDRYEPFFICRNRNEVQIYTHDELQ